MESLTHLVHLPNRGLVGGGWGPAGQNLAQVIQGQQDLHGREGSQLLGFEVKLEVTAVVGHHPLGFVPIEDRGQGTGQAHHPDIGHRLVGVGHPMAEQGLVVGGYGPLGPPDQIENGGSSGRLGLGEANQGGPQRPSAGPGPLGGVEHAVLRVAADLLSVGPSQVGPESAGTLHPVTVPTTEPNHQNHPGPRGGNCLFKKI